MPDVSSLSPNEADKYSVSVWTEVTAEEISRHADSSIGADSSH